MRIFYSARTNPCRVCVLICWLTVRQCVLLFAGKSKTSGFSSHTAHIPPPLPTFPSRTQHSNAKLAECETSICGCVCVFFSSWWLSTFASCWRRFHLSLRALRFDRIWGGAKVGINHFNFTGDWIIWSLVAQVNALDLCSTTTTTTTTTTTMKTKMPSTQITDLHLDQCGELAIACVWMKCGLKTCALVHRLRLSDEREVIILSMVILSGGGNLLLLLSNADKQSSSLAVQKHTTTTTTHHRHRQHHHRCCRCDALTVGLFSSVWTEYRWAIRHFERCAECSE